MIHIKNIKIITSIIILSTLIIFSFGYYKNSYSESGKGPVIIILIESLRADHLPCYGYHRNTTLNICNLADDGVLFENAYSQGTWTAMSVPYLLTSSLGSGVDNWTKSLAENYITLAERLKKEGYDTIGAGKVSDLYVNTDQGLNEVNPQWILESRNEKSPWFRRWEINGSRIKENDFLYYFVSEPHGPFIPPNEFRGIYENISKNLTELDWEPTAANLGNPSHKKMMDTNKEELISLYDEELLYVDQNVDNILDGLKERGLYQKSTIVVTGDHGVRLGERGGWLHMGPPDEEVIHVPLIIKFPKNKFAGTRVNQLVRHMDIVPTIYDILGINEDTYGQSLVPAINGKKLDINVFSAEKINKNWMIKNKNYKLTIGNPRNFCASLKSGEKTSNYNLTRYTKEKKEVYSIKKQFCEIYSEDSKRRDNNVKNIPKEELKKRLKEIGYIR
ncbi:MAG: sulfatase [Candidatus Aenigmatarchaeota archaeon]